MGRAAKEISEVISEGVGLLQELQRRGLPLPDLEPSMELLGEARAVLPEKAAKRAGELIPPTVDIGGMDLAQLCDFVQGCQACKLAKTRIKVAFGTGSGQNGLMLVGEGPGQTEDETGVPFVGRAGKFLDKMLEAAGFPREQVYITNIVKCRPPGNRDPEVEEIRACRAYLDAQIRLLKPRLLVAVGRPAALTLLETGTALSGLRGQLHLLRGIPLMVTYHPAYLLRSPSYKAEAWKDWRQIRNTLAAIQAGNRPKVGGLIVEGGQ